MLGGRGARGKRSPGSRQPTAAEPRLVTAGRSGSFWRREGAPAERGAAVSTGVLSGADDGACKPVREVRTVLKSGTALRGAGLQLGDGSSEPRAGLRGEGRWLRGELAAPCSGVTASLGLNHGPAGEDGFRSASPARKWKA